MLYGHSLSSRLSSSTRQAVATYGKLVSTRSGAVGFGTYREGLESGVVDHDAAGISLLAAAITLGRVVC